MYTVVRFNSKGKRVFVAKNLTKVQADELALGRDNTKIFKEVL